MSPVPTTEGGGRPPVRDPPRARGLDADARLALATLAALLVITAAWWALALWPVPGETPAWLELARAVCFNATESGLPGPSGWMVLIGQPIGMVALLLVGWGPTVRRGLAALRASGVGRATLTATALLVLTGLTAAWVRVDRAAAEPTLAAGSVPLPSTYPRLDRPTPTDALVDQHGRRVAVADLAAASGSPVFVTFAFGHCETVCPAVVHQLRAAREALAGEVDPTIVVVTLDPWRDTPSRLPSLVERWQLGHDDRVLSGSVQEVEAALDAWEIPRSRDLRTGDITHPALVYLIDRSGGIVYASTGRVDEVVELARRMGP